MVMENLILAYGAAQGVASDIADTFATDVTQTLAQTEFAHVVTSMSAEVRNHSARSRSALCVVDVLTHISVVDTTVRCSAWRREYGFHANRARLTTVSGVDSQIYKSGNSKRHRLISGANEMLYDNPSTLGIFISNMGPEAKNQVSRKDSTDSLFKQDNTANWFQPTESDIKKCLSPDVFAEVNTFPEYQNYKEHFTDLQQWVPHLNRPIPDEGKSLAHISPLAASGKPMTEAAEANARVQINISSGGHQVFNISKEHLRFFHFGTRSRYYFGDVRDVFLFKKSSTIGEENVLVRGSSLHHFAAQPALTLNDRSPQPRGEIIQATYRYEGNLNTEQVTTAPPIGAQSTAGETHLQNYVQGIHLNLARKQLRMQSPHLVFCASDVHAYGTAPQARAQIEIAAADASVIAHAQTKVQLTAGPSSDQSNASITVASKGVAIKAEQKIENKCDAFAIEASKGLDVKAPRISLDKAMIISNGKVLFS